MISRSRPCVAVRVISFSEIELVRSISVVSRACEAGTISEINASSLPIST